MTEEQVIDWIMLHLQKKTYMNAVDLAKEMNTDNLAKKFCNQYHITKENDPVFEQFMKVSMRLAGEI